jgi:hypothetical protein
MVLHNNHYHLGCAGLRPSELSAKPYRELKDPVLMAGVSRGQFHDLRRTALSNLLANGMSEYDVMTLAGHSDFATTHKFYLAVADDLVERARAAAAQAISKNLLQICCSSGIGGLRQKGC